MEKHSNETVRKAPERSLAEEVQSALQWLKEHSTKATLDGMARYAIPSDHALGVAMRDIEHWESNLEHDQELATALWQTEVYEARFPYGILRFRFGEQKHGCGDFRPSSAKVS